MKRRAVPGSKIRRIIRKRSTFTVFPDASEPIWFRGVFSINVSPPAYHGHDDDRYRTTDFQGKCGTAGADAIRKSPPDWSWTVSNRTDECRIYFADQRLLKRPSGFSVTYPVQSNTVSAAYRIATETFLRIIFYFCSNDRFPRFYFQSIIYGQKPALWKKQFS